MKRIVSLVGAAALALSMAAPADAHGPVRWGSVAGGPIDTGPSSSCVLAPDCLVWLASGCDQYLAGLDPALQTSIVDVRALEGSSATRRFVPRPTTVARKSGHAVRGVRIGGFRVQLWTAGCREVHPSPPIWDAKATSYREYIRHESRFRIPSNVAWMTAAADDNVLVEWELW